MTISELMNKFACSRGQAERALRDIERFDTAYVNCSAADLRWALFGVYMSVLQELLVTIILRSKQENRPPSDFAHMVMGFYRK